MSKSFVYLICIFFTIALVFAITPYTEEEKSCKSCKYDIARPIIVNGKPISRFSKYPFLVALVDEDAIFCGGVIISSTFILTAAHCVSDLEMKKKKKCQTKNTRMPEECFLEPKKLKIGYLNDSRKSNVIKRKVSRIIPHPDFSFVRKINDIALVELNRPIVCLDLPRPICLPTRNLSKVGNELVIAGWGREKKYKVLEDYELKEGKVNQIELHNCVSETRPKPKNILCAGGKESKQISCRGDSGSGAFMIYKGNYYAMGVASTSYCDIKEPSVYAEVYLYIDWIKSIVKNLASV